MTVTAVTVYLAHGNRATHRHGELPGIIYSAVFAEHQDPCLTCWLPRVGLAVLPTPTTGATHGSYVLTAEARTGVTLA